MNVVILRGTLSSDPVRRELASGSSLVQYEVTTRGDEGPAASVPVAWFDPPASLPDLATGAEVVVAVQVRRRFFRTGGVPVSQKRRVERLVSEALSEIV